MSSILCVHGIGQQLKGEEVVASEWRGALRDGMRHAGAATTALPGDSDIAVTFYGDLFREQVTKGFEPAYELVDIEMGLEADLVWLLLSEAERTRGSAARGESKEVTKSGWQMETVQDAAVALLRQPFFAHLTERLFVGALKQVRRYFADSVIRQQVRARLASNLRPGVKAVIAHSLGSIVAYEVLCQAKNLNIPTLITLGSPLGLPNLVFERLDPKPVNGKGTFPSCVNTWANISDRHDVVSAVKQLAPLFGPKVRDLNVANEASAHDVVPYLTAPQTGKLIEEALRD